METIGISILTNGCRRKYLSQCIDSFFNNCHYRPLVVGIFDNGSQDDTAEFLKTSLPKIDGVKWRVESSSIDLGVSKGTNKAISLVSDCRYALHLECDWELLSKEESGEDGFWLHRALDCVRSGKCDYLYLRRMINENEMMIHWWSQWMSKIDRVEAGQMRCPGFWWSNNPALRDNYALREQGVLPLPEIENEYKGSPVWGQCELQAKKPSRPWLMKWGVFIHDRPNHKDYAKQTGCGNFGPYGVSTCKYGFFKDGSDAFCMSCDLTKSYKDMEVHESRFRNNEVWKAPIKIKVVILNHNKPETSEILYQKLSEVFEDIEFIDSGSDKDKIPKSITLKFPNIYWEGAWSYVMSHSKEADVIWVLGGDIKLLDAPLVYKKAIEAAYPFGCWSPSIEGRAHDFMLSKYYWGQRKSVKNVEGMALAVSNKLLEHIGRKFELTTKYGFGQDFWLCAKSLEFGLTNYIDGSVKVFHPEEIGYNESEALDLMEDAFGRAYGPSYRRSFFNYFEHFHKNLLEGENMMNDNLTIATIDNGWGVDEFERITSNFPNCKKVIMKKGLSDFSQKTKAKIVEYDSSLKALYEADILLFTKIGNSNVKEFEELLAAGKPIVANVHYHNNKIKHEQNGFIYEDISWGVAWIRNLVGSEALRTKIENFAKEAKDELPKIPMVLEKIELEEKDVKTVIVPEVKVTIITPTYRRDPRTVSRCLDCVRLQTLKSFEQIVCSDGFKEEQIESLVASKKDPRITYTHTSIKKPGDFGNTVRSEILAKAKGKYVFFLDDDNLILPDYLEEMVNLLESSGKDFAICKIVHFGPLNEKTGTPPIVLEGNPVELYHIDPLQVVVKREVMQEIGWDTEKGYLSDGYTLQKLGEKFECVYLSKVLGFHM
jgi:glycosyltransferase involved in cell wall biosynthesis